MNTFNPDRINDVNAKYGAPMGRSDVYEATEVQRVRLSRLKFVDGDYDEGGAYWGSPANVYWCRNHSGTIELFVRAESREDAWEKLREEYPDLYLGRKHEASSGDQGRDTTSSIR